MKSRSKNSIKAKKQMFAAKNVINYSSLETGSDLCLQWLNYKYKSIEKLFKKYKAQKPKIVLETRYFNKSKQN